MSEPPPSMTPTEAAQHYLDWQATPMIDDLVRQALARSDANIAAFVAEQRATPATHQHLVYRVSGDDLSPRHPGYYHAEPAGRIAETFTVHFLVPNEEAEGMGAYPPILEAMARWRYRKLNGLGEVVA